MKNRIIILSALTLFMMQSCMVTRSRYGNGIRIEFPERFTKSDQKSDNPVKQRTRPVQSISNPAAQPEIKSSQKPAEYVSMTIENEDSMSKQGSVSLSEVPDVKLKRSEGKVKLRRFFNQSERNNKPILKLDSRMKKSVSFQNHKQIKSYSFLGDFWNDLIILLCIVAGVGLLLLAIFEPMTFVLVLLAIGIGLLFAALGIEMPPLSFC